MGGTLWPKVLCCTKIDDFALCLTKKHYTLGCKVWPKVQFQEQFKCDFKFWVKRGETQIEILFCFANITLLNLAWKLSYAFFTCNQVPKVCWELHLSPYLWVIWKNPFYTKNWCYTIIIDHFILNILTVHTSPKKYHLAMVL